MDGCKLNVTFFFWCGLFIRLWLQAYDRFLPYGFEEEDAFFEEVDSSELIEDEIGWYRCCFRGRGVTVRHSMAFGPFLLVVCSRMPCSVAIKFVTNYTCFTACRPYKTRRCRFEERVGGWKGRQKPTLGYG